MLKYFLLVTLIITSLSLYSATAEEILASKNVVVYDCGQDIFLLDLNTSFETQITTGAVTDDFALDKTGNVIFTVKYNDYYDESWITLYEMRLPSIKADSIAYLKVKSTINENVHLGTAIYLNKTQNLTIVNRYGDPVGGPKTVAQYNLTTKKMSAVFNGTFNPTRDAYHQIKYNPVVTNGYGIINKSVGLTNELFIKSPTNGNPDNLVQLTDLSDFQQEYSLSSDEIQFTVSPDSSLILFGIQYYIGDDTTPFYATFSVTADGKNQQLLNDVAMIGNNFDYEWISNNSLVCVGMKPNSDHKSAIMTMNKDGIYKVIKVFEEDGSPYSIQYRYPNK